jgi:hypothetical protein
MKRLVFLFLAGLAAAAAFVLFSGRAHHVTPLCNVSAPSGRYQFTIDQATNAATIAAVGKTAGLPDHAVTIALAAALQESGLHNLAGGDRDSVGLFQQRPSQGWGTPAELQSPRFAAAAFFGALRTVSGWETMPVTQAAQLVQRSAAPDAYAAWEGQARALAEALTGEIPAGLACQYDASSETTPAAPLADAMQAELGSASFANTGAAHQWLLASWLVAHASAYKITSVSFGTFRWADAKAVWTSSNPYRSQLAVTLAGQRLPITSGRG